MGFRFQSGTLSPIANKEGAVNTAPAFILLLVILYYFASFNASLASSKNSLTWIDTPAISSVWPSSSL